MTATPSAPASLQQGLLRKNQVFPVVLFARCRSSSARRCAKICSTLARRCDAAPRSFLLLLGREDNFLLQSRVDDDSQQLLAHAQSG